MSLPLKWEFPGGKIEDHETPEDCLVREIKEELNIEIEIVSPIEPNQHAYPSVTINLLPFICRKKSGEITLMEHAAFEWLEANKVLGLDWAEADVPIIHNYLKYLDATT